MVSMLEWQDPYGPPVFELHDDIFVVRDDLLNYGSKIRFLDYLIGHAPEYQHIQEWVFGSVPFCGYAQISLPAVCNRYGKKAVLFMAKRKPENYHEYQKRGLALGAEYHWVNMGMLTVTQRRAKDYVDERPDIRKALPIGLEHSYVLQSIVKVAHQLPFEPDIFWTVGSSGTTNRGLQMAWPKAEAHVVQVGHKMNMREIGNAIHHESPYRFEQPVRHEDKPPFPSALNYDAKGWAYMKYLYGNCIPKDKKILFWNVGA